MPMKAEENAARMHGRSNGGTSESVIVLFPL